MIAQTPPVVNFPDTSDPTLEHGNDDQTSVRSKSGPHEWDVFECVLFPFGAPRREYRETLRRFTNQDLDAEIEHQRYLCLEFKDTHQPSYDVACIFLEEMVREKLRRRRLSGRNPGDPFNPEWPAPDPMLQARIERLKRIWPISRFCSEMLMADLVPSGKDRWKARCPLPGHDDRTPSFTVYEDRDRAWCHGCHRGGDIIDLTGYALGIASFFERLERLESLPGTLLEVGVA